MVDPALLQSIKDHVIETRYIIVRFMLEQSPTARVALYDMICARTQGEMDLRFILRANIRD